jgi:hypothetical protein
MIIYDLNNCRKLENTVFIEFESDLAVVLEVI